MEKQEYVMKKKELYNFLIVFINTNSQIDYDKFINFIKDENLTDNKEELNHLLHMILYISKSHHRTSQFFNQIEIIFSYLEDKIKQTFTNSQLFHIFKSSKQILLFLFEKNILIPDEYIANFILGLKGKWFERGAIELFVLQMKLDINYNYLFYYLYFYPEIESFLEEDQKKLIENRLQKYKPNIITKFDKKRKNTENDSYICQLIRNDSIEEFILYSIENNLDLNSTVKFSILETNLFLCKNIKLIEYAAFFGSIQIIQYLQKKEVQLTSSLWLYSIHSNNIELIHFLEKNQIEPNDKTFEECFKEAIKCHHNNIAHYINDNLINENIKKNCQYLKNLYNYCLHYHNFEFLPNENINDRFLFYSSCKYNYYTLVKIIIKKIYFYIDYIHVDSCKENTDAFQIAVNKNNVEIYMFLLAKIGNEINYLMFSNTNIKSFIIPSSITSIGFDAFKNCSQLSFISIPSSVKSIGNGAFINCDSLKQIEIPSSVTEIKNHTFDGCKMLTQIVIHSSITKIEEYAFFNCSSLTQIEIPSSVTEIKNHTFDGCKMLKQIVIHSSITKIEEYAFFDCSSLTQIEIPSSVTEIGDYAFKNCSSIIQISINSSFIKIGKGIFSECSKLTKIKIDNNESCFTIFDNKLLLMKSDPNIEQFDVILFALPSSEIIEIPSFITKIGANSFDCCSSVKQIKFNDNSKLKTIGSYAFINSKIESIRIPSNVEHIGKNAFCNCQNLQTIQFQNHSKLGKIKKGTFCFNTSIQTIDIPENVVHIDDLSFNGCYKLKNIHFSDNSKLETIGMNAFSSTAIHSICFPPHVSKINKEAFYYCKNIKIIEISEKLESFEIYHSFEMDFDLIFFAPSNFDVSCVEISRIDLFFEDVD